MLLKTPRHNPPSATEIALLAYEHEILRGLSVSGIPKVFDFLSADRGCYLVLEDSGAAPLQTLLVSRRPDLEGFFQLALQLCTILVALHRQDLIHQTLNPRSILVHLRTGEVSLIDFSFASRASHGNPTPLPIHLLHDTLAYVSPEQTGRMNRATDYRSDFYSLGVTFYELLTGGRPLRSEDALELIHWHIARVPLAPAKIDPTIPAPLSQIVIKLLAKTPEERYQSALGLSADLEQCAHEWAACTQIASFPLGQRDVSDRFLIPQRLYGRDHEVVQLLEAFDHTCRGPAALLLVAGYSGIGKTSLVQELYRPIVRERGYFVAGKFDQVARNVPYGGLLQAFRELIRQLLMEKEERLAVWRTWLAEALGNNGGVVAEVLPEIELLLGKQPAPPPLGPTEAQNRFQRVFQNFLRALARKEHPLVIFLDDLQWADAATLGLLPVLLTTPDIQYLFLIGAYRDNEVDASHPLEYAVRGLEAAGADIHRLFLSPLGLADLTVLLRDTLHGELSEIDPLAHLILRKTGGNPFFVIQFLKALQQEELVAFDYERGRWAFQLEVVAGAAITDNVIDLMTRKIQRLSPETQQMLTRAACIGIRFDTHTLALISHASPDAVTSNLKEASEEGLLLPLAHAYEVSAPHGSQTRTQAAAYAFLHDRIQQAAYALIPDEQKQMVHLTVGRLLSQQDDALRIEEQLFDIAHHLNLGRGLITHEAERGVLARLNLRTGHKAKVSAAYEAARVHLTIAVELFSEKSWDSDYDFAFTLHLEAAECTYLCSRFTEAEQAYDRLLEKARTRLDKAKVYTLKILQYEHTSRYAEAIQAARDGIALFGVSFPYSFEEKQVALETELAAIQTLMGYRTIESLIDLSVMSDPEIRTVMRLLSNLHTSCFLSGDKPLTLLNIATMIHLSLAYGNIEESAYAYVLRAAMLDGPIREDYQTAYEFGLLALRLNERLYDPALRAKILMTFAWSVSHWRRPLEESFPHTREAFRLGNETGLFVDAAWALFNEMWFAMLTTSNLVEFHRIYAPNVDYSDRIKMGHIADGKRILRQWGRALQGLTKHPCSFSDATFDEDAYCQTYGEMRLFQMFHIVLKLALLYTFEEYQAAIEAAQRAEEIIRTDFTGTIWDEIRTFYHALTLSALYAKATADECEETKIRLDALHARLRKWAENSPNNFQAQHLIVAAEIARVHGKDGEAIALYEAAIEAAARHQRQKERALANELYAKFRHARGQHALAAVFMAEARDVYAQWGAAAKVRALQQKYTALFDGPGSETARTAHAGAEGTMSLAVTEIGTSTFDVVTAMKAAQALAGEMDLEKLLERLMRLAIENAGAERGSLILEHGGEAFVHAEGSMEGVEVKVNGGIPLDTAPNLPTGIVNYVRRTCESVVLADATNDDRYATDTYIVCQQPRSIVCTPVLNQGRLIGVLYLENNLATGAFTDDRIKVMQLISAEAAISLENARLYEEMKQEVARRRQAEEELRVALAEVESLKNRLQAENVYLQEEIRTEHNFEEMVGNSATLLDVLRKVELVAPIDATVLILGETGVGKELIARAIHSRSKRKDRPLVKLNCGAISTGLVESELFGHVKGAFTGALEKRLGRFELAHGGTLFLDEVGELPLETQVKLLRVLQEQEFEPVGSSRTVQVDVRIITATNRDLEEAVRAGRFRSDLFYRLNVFPLRVPPLRERRSDIPKLVLFFLSRFAKQFGKQISRVTQDTMDRLLNYVWPGNVRELQNLIERAVILSQEPVLTVDPNLLPGIATDVMSVPQVFQEEAAGRDDRNDPEEPFSTEILSGESLSLEALERRHILAVLKQTGGVIEGPKGAARFLNLHPNTLRSRMKKLGIKRSTA